jgi:DNA repair protein RecO (recombination protein O)
LLLLAELGYGLEIDSLPNILRTGGEAGWPDIVAALRITGNALETNILTDRRAETLTARARLIDRLKRAVA